MQQFIYRELLGTAWYVELHFDMKEAKLCCPKGWFVKLYKGEPKLSNTKWAW
jgi:hypothetical protein